MSPKKIERLIRVLREQGVEYIKTPEIEIRLREHSPVASVSPIHRPDTAESVSVPTVPEAARTAAAIPPVDSHIPHHENQVAKLLKLSDEDLVDKLFPDYTQIKTGSV